MSNGELRRSARILELEAKRAQEGGNNKKYYISSDDDEGQSSCRQKRKKSKVGHACRKNATNPVPASVVQSETPLPQIATLELLLDILDQRDTHKVLSEPIDVGEFIGIAKIIKHPMDFSTISTKLDKGKYVILEEFESDVLLALSNATILIRRRYGSHAFQYRQVRAVREVAIKLFAALRADVTKFEVELAPARIVGTTWANADARLINSLVNSLSKTSVTTEEVNSEAVLPPQTTYDRWASSPWNEEPVSAPSSAQDSIETLSLINQLMHGQSSPNLGNNMLNISGAGGQGQVAQRVAGPPFNEYNGGALIDWLSSPVQHHIPNHQVVPVPVPVPVPVHVPAANYPGNGLFPSIQANPFGFPPPAASGHNVNAPTLRDGSNAANPPAPGAGPSVDPTLSLAMSWNGYPGF